MSAKKRSWTQAICQWCWYASETRTPVALSNPEREQCCDCGRVTYDGIYVRRDPWSVNFPRYEED